MIGKRESSFPGRSSRRSTRSGPTWAKSHLIGPQEPPYKMIGELRIRQVRRIRHTRCCVRTCGACPHLVGRRRRACRILSRRGFCREALKGFPCPIGSRTRFVGWWGRVRSATLPGVSLAAAGGPDESATTWIRRPSRDHRRRGQRGASRTALPPLRGPLRVSLTHLAVPGGHWFVGDGHTGASGGGSELRVVLRARGEEVVGTALPVGAAPSRPTT